MAHPRMPCVPVAIPVLRHLPARSPPPLARSQVRFSQLSAVAAHFLEHAVAHEGALPELTLAAAQAPHVWSADGAPPFVKGSGSESARPKPLPAAVTTAGIGGGRKPSAALGEPVPSRRREGATSPSVDVTPGVRRVTKGGHAAALLQLELYEEATLHQSTLLAHLAPGERVLRSIAELNHLRARVARDLAAVPTATRLADVEFWRRLTTRLLRSPHLHDELRSVLRRYDAICGAVINASPGEELCEEHDIAQLLEVQDRRSWLEEEAPVVATWQQMGWLLQATERNPLGRLRHDQRPTRKARAPRSTGRKGVQAKPMRVVRFADSADADVAMATRREAGEEEAGGEEEEEREECEEGAEGAEGEASEDDAAADDEGASPFVPTGYRPVEQVNVNALLAAASVVDEAAATQATQATQPVPEGALGFLASIANRFSFNRSTPVLPFSAAASASSASASPPCSYCGEASGTLFRCQRCGDAVCHAACCSDAIEALGAACSAEHLCLPCVGSVREARAQEQAEQHSATVVKAVERLTSDETLLHRLQVAGWGARAAAVLAAHSAALDTLAAAAGLDEGHSRYADVKLRLGILVASQHLRGASPDAAAASAAVDAVRHLAEVAEGGVAIDEVAPLDAECMVECMDSVLDLFDSTALPSRKLRSLRQFKADDVDAQLRALLADVVLPEIGVVLPADLARRLQAQADGAGGEEEASSTPTRWRDRARRLVESMYTLATNATIGNKDAMPNFKMLQRLVSKFGRERRSTSEFRSSLRWSPRRGPEDAWLRKRTLRLHQERRKASADGEAGVLLQSSDNASLNKMTQPGLGLTERVTLCVWTAIGSTRLHPAGTRGRDGGELPRHVARYVATNVDSSLFSYAVHDPRPGRPCAWPPDRSLPTDAAQIEAANFQAFDGTLNDAARLVPGMVNLGDTAAPISGGSQQCTLMLAVTEEMAASRRASVFEDGALDDVSTLVLPMRGVRFAKRLPHGTVDVGGFEAGDADGMRAHSRDMYAAQWDDERNELRRTTLHPGVPLPEDSLSAMGAAAVALQLALEHGLRHPGFYGRLGAKGDGDRAFYQGDGACLPPPPFGALRHPSSIVCRPPLSHSPRSSLLAPWQLARRRSTLPTCAGSRCVCGRRRCRRVIRGPTSSQRRRKQWAHCSSSPCSWSRTISTHNSTTGWPSSR